MRKRFLLYPLFLLVLTLFLPYASATGRDTDTTGQVFALLYANGELVFQKNDTPNPAKTLLATYPVAVADSGVQYAPWYDRRADIKTVTFADTLQPRSTAYWFYECILTNDKVFLS